MSGTVVLCFEGPDGTPIAVSAANPMPAASTGGPAYIEESEKGQPNGVATLDGSGKIPAAQIDPAVVPTFVAADGKVNQGADLNVPALYTAAVSGLYRVSAFVAITRAATTSSTMPNVSVSYTEAMSGAAVQDIVTQQGNTNLVGLHSGGSAVINAQQGANIGYITSGYASAGATSMQYGVQVKIEFVG